MTRTFSDTAHTETPPARVRDLMTPAPVTRIGRSRDIQAPLPVAAAAPRQAHPTRP